MKTKTYIVEMPEGWEAGDCYVCHIKCAPIAGKHYPCINPPCPLANAKKAVEVARGEVKISDMIEEPTFIGNTDISMSFPDGKNISVFYTEE